MTNRFDPQLEAVRLYRTGLSLRSIVTCLRKHEIEVSHETVRRWLREQGVRRRRRQGGKPRLDEAAIVKAYKSRRNRKSVQEIALEFDCATSSVTRIVRKRKVRMRRTLRIAPDAVKRRAFRLYISDEKATFASVAQQVGYSWQSVREWILGYQQRGKRT